MMRHARLEHRFAQHIPETLDPGVLYISMEYATAAHSCCCGCGEEVVTPFTSTDWKMTYDGETVSLWPSIGNWEIPCRSHYLIERGKVIKAAPWTEEEIAAERRRDKMAKAWHYGSIGTTEAVEPKPIPMTSSKESPRLWSKINQWLSELL
jgi:hypothetical protein